MQTKKNWGSHPAIKVIIISIICIAIVIILNSSVSQSLNIETIKSNEEQLRAFVADNYILSVSIHMVAYILNTALSLPFATVLTLGGGFIFGIVAVIYNTIGATVGAAILFFIARYIAGDFVQSKYASQLEEFNKNITNNAVNYMLFLRLIPAFPFFLVNLLAGLTTIKARTFIWTTFVGIIPGSFVFTYTGTQLATINSPSDIISPRVTLAFVFLGLLSIAPIIIKKYKKNV